MVRTRSCSEQSRSSEAFENALRLWFDDTRLRVAGGRCWLNGIAGRGLLARRRDGKKEIEPRLHTRGSDTWSGLLRPEDRFWRRLLGGLELAALLRQSPLFKQSLRGMHGPHFLGDRSRFVIASAKNGRRL